MSVSPAAVPSLRRGIRRQFDATRAAHVLLGPERVVVLDDIAVAIVELVDGKHSVAEISTALADKFAASLGEVQADVTAFVQELADKGLVSL